MLQISKMKKVKYSFILIALVLGCANPATDNNQEVTVYTHRHYEVDMQLFEQFTAETGIEVNVVKAAADQLMVRLKNEGKNSEADLLITVDAGRLVKAREDELLQAISSTTLNELIPENLRDSDGHWYGLTKRARVIVYDKERVNPTSLSTYEQLVDEEWAGRLLVRSSDNIYNQSLVASMVARSGGETTSQWVTGLIAAMARDPKGNDRDQVKAIAAGEGDIAIVNTYYIGKLLNSEDAEEVKAGKSVGVFFPNQQDRGTHINISGAGITKYAPNKENAIKLLEFLAKPGSQKLFAEGNYEYPVHADVAPSELLASWGAFKEDNLRLEELGKNNRKAVEIMYSAGWK